MLGCHILEESLACPNQVFELVGAPRQRKDGLPLVDPQIELSKVKEAFDKPGEFDPQASEPAS